jgi:hypothetical protein
MKVKISKGGKITFIYSDDLQPLMKTGKATIKRASHVEPIESGEWIADMSPIQQGVILGPFSKRQKAIDAEIFWLQEEIMRRIK